MSKELIRLRELIRRDLDSVGLIPTGMGVQVVASEDPNLAFALYCESVYVRLFNKHEIWDIMQYLEESMRLDPDEAKRIIHIAIHARDVLASHGGDQRLAVRDLMAERNVEEMLIREVVSTAFRVSEEYHIGWDMHFQENYARKQSKKRLRSRLLVLGTAGVLVLVAVVAVWLAVRLYSK